MPLAQCTSPCLAENSLSSAGFALDLRCAPRSPGFAPDAKISAYAKLLPMLAGIGSPGTLQEVLSSPIAIVMRCR